MFSTAEAWGVVGTADGCSDHPCNIGFTEADIDVVFWYDYGCNCGSYSEAREKAEREAAERVLIEGKAGLDDVDTFGRDGAMCAGYCDTWSTAILRLKSGKYVYAYESSDTSGHG